MYLFSNNSKMNDSLIFYLYKNKKVQLYSKSNNKIYGYYRDSILDDFVYLASNGLNVTNFRKKIIHPEVFNESSYKFVSYFSTLEDNFLRLNLYPKKYSYKLLKKYIKTNKVVSIWEERRKKSWPTSKFLYFFPVFIKNYQKYKHLKYLLNNHVTSSRFRFYKHKGHRFFLSKPGRLIQISNKFVYRVWFFRFISKFIPAPIRISFMPVMKLGYLITRYLSRVFSDKFFSFDSFYNLLVYRYYFRFIQLIFRKGMFNNKLEKRGLRCSNGIVFSYFTVLDKKFNTLTTFLLNIIKEKLTSNNIYNWTNFFIYGKSLVGTSLNLKEENDIKNFVNALPNDLKLYLIEKLSIKSALYSSNKLVNFLNTQVHNVYDYLILKSVTFLLFTKNLKYFSIDWKNFEFKTIKFYVYNLINNKIRNFIKTFHGNQRKSYALGTLRNSSLYNRTHKQKKTSLAKIYFKYKYTGKIFLLKNIIRKIKLLRKNLRFDKFLKLFKMLNLKIKNIFRRKNWWTEKGEFTQFKQFQGFSKKARRILALRFASVRKAWSWKTLPIWNKNRKARIKSWRTNVYKQIRHFKFRTFPFFRNRAWLVYWMFKYKNRGELRLLKRIKGYREKWWNFTVLKRFTENNSPFKVIKNLRKASKSKDFNIAKLIWQFRPFFSSYKKIPRKIVRGKIFKELKRIKRFFKFKSAMFYPFLVMRRVYKKYKYLRRFQYSKLAIIKYKLKYSKKPYKHIRLTFKSRYVKDPNKKLIFRIAPELDKKAKHKNKQNYKRNKFRFNTKNTYKYKNFKKNWKNKTKNKKQFLGYKKPFFQGNKNSNQKKQNFKGKKKVQYGNNLK